MLAELASLTEQANALKSRRNSAEFTRWRLDAETCLAETCGAESTYVRNFKGIPWTATPPGVRYSLRPDRRADLAADLRARMQAQYERHLELAQGIFASATKYLERGAGETASSDDDLGLDGVRLVARRLHAVAVQLRDRRAGQDPLLVKNEYDVQYVLRALLAVVCEDVRVEEPTPSMAGKSARTDIFLADYDSFVEAKMTRQGLRDAEIGSQILEDIARYQGHPRCKLLICVVYDPDCLLRNPAGLFNDLHDPTGERHGLPVEMFIIPQR